MNSAARTCNPDLVKERKNATVDVEKLKVFFGTQIYSSAEKYQKALAIRDDFSKAIKPIFYENFYNLERGQKFEMICKKSIEMIEFFEKLRAKDKDVEGLIESYLMSAVLGSEKFLFSLHFTMFKQAVELWGTKEQFEYWTNFMEKNCILGTHVQTELGHGTYVRGIETTATYDKSTQEFIIHSPTLTSTKFWPGTAGKCCNHAIVMAKLIIDGTDHGLHAFIVQLRSLVDHTSMPGVEVGDIGKKFGFDATDNGYVRFNNYRIPRFNMLMQFSRVTPDGRFERLGNELLMYATMMLMRGTLCLQGGFYLSISTTIAIRYSAVRHQTANAEGYEPQILDYQTQQYRLFPALATTYALTYAGTKFYRYLKDTQNTSNYFKDVKPSVLAQLHAVSSGLKAVSFGDCLKFAQLNRLCCGGHGYSMASGLPQIIQEADAGCTYEGDNVVLLLQVGRYILKCAQKGISPHFELPEHQEIINSNVYRHFEELITLYYRLYDEAINECGSKMLTLIKEKGMSELDAWNQTSVQLIQTARIYIEIFIIVSSVAVLMTNNDKVNQQGLNDLFELYLLYGICENNAGHMLRFNLLEGTKLTEYQQRLYQVLAKIRPNAVAFVDAFNMPDSSLCSSLGVYDGNVYERLLEFARNSQFNEKDVHDVYYKYLKPFSLVQSRIQSAKL